MSSYGTFLRVILVLLISAVLMVVMTGSAAAESDVYLGINFHPFTLDGKNETCVDFEDSVIGQTRNCDPINLIFPGRTSAEVSNLLLNESWSFTSAGTSQRLHYDSTQLYVQDEQLIKQNTIFSPRYHIRLWQAPGDTLVTFAAVHHEDLLHNIDMDWEQAEADVAAVLCGSDCQQTGLLTTQSAIQGNDNEWRGRFNNRSATVIPGPNTPTPTATATNTPTPTDTPTNTPTPTATPTNTPTPTDTPTNTPTPTDTPANTPTPTDTPTNTPTPTDTPVADIMHVGGLGGRSVLAPRNRWDAGVSVAVHDASEGMVANATVNGSWSVGGGGTCITDASGRCDIFKNNIKGNEDSVTFTVTSVSANGYIYDAAANHDPDGDSDGTTIVVYQDGPPAPTPTPEPGVVMHIGDLDGSGVLGPRNRWTATVIITVHDADEGTLSGATVSGSWSVGRDGGACTTDANGRCSIVKNDVKSNEPSATFTVDAVSLTGGTYDNGANHDPDGDSNGTSITILQP